MAVVLAQAAGLVDLLLGTHTNQKQSSHVISSTRWCPGRFAFEKDQ
jgi:hypothetical protein